MLLQWFHANTSLVQNPFVVVLLSFGVAVNWLVCYVLKFNSPINFYDLYPYPYGWSEENLIS